MEHNPGNPSTPRFPQFRLRTLFGTIGFLSLLFATLRAVGVGTSLLLLFGLTLVFFHVVGNVLGTRLKDSALASDLAASRSMATRREIHAREQFRRARLGERTPLSRLISVTSWLGGMSGGALGGLALHHWGHVTVAGLAVGAISSGVVGAFFGFLAGSFVESTYTAWSQAVEPPPARRDQPGTSPTHA